MPKSRRPASPRRLAANRANAAKSTGPRTPEGKARSSQNARKHQFTGSTFAVVRLEDLQFDRLKALREELPNKPITGPHLEPTETTYPALPTNPVG